MKISDDQLIAMAIAARSKAYAPYSSFQVGAALLTQSGAVFCGANVENLSYGLTICAERVAVGSALVAGDTVFDRLIVVADTDEPISPCGACRQVLAEFAPDLPIIAATLAGRRERLSLATLLPRAATGILNRP